MSNPEPLVRSVPFRATENTDGTTLEGYAAVFDTPIEVDNWEGRFTEIIQKGAFAKAVRSNPRPVMQFDHGTHPYIGSIPIGPVEELREDDRGLYVRAQLHTGEFFSPVREAIASGSIGGMSFKFTIPKGGVSVTHGDDGHETRTLTDINLHELGPVVWPAYKATTVGVRTQEIVKILNEDEEARHELMAGLVFADSLADRTSEEEPSEETDPDEASVESDRTSEEEPSAATKSRIATVKAIVAAQTERVLRNDQERQFNGTESETDGRPDQRPQ